MWRNYYNSNIDVWEKCDFKGRKRTLLPTKYNNYALAFNDIYHIGSLRLHPNTIIYLYENGNFTGRRVYFVAGPFFYKYVNCQDIGFIVRSMIIKRVDGYLYENFGFTNNTYILLALFVIITAFIAFICQKN